MRDWHGSSGNDRSEDGRKLGLPNFGPEFTVSCENHGGGGLGAVKQWDAAAGAWSLITGYGPSDQDVIGPLVAEDSAAFASENGIEPGCN